MGGGGEGIGWCRNPHDNVIYKIRAFSFMKFLVEHNFNGECLSSEISTISQLGTTF